MGVFTVLGYNFSGIRSDMVGNNPTIKPFLAFMRE